MRCMPTCCNSIPFSSLTSLLAFAWRKDLCRSSWRWLARADSFPFLSFKVRHSEMVCVPLGYREQARSSGGLLIGLRFGLTPVAKGLMPDTCLCSLCVLMTESVSCCTVHLSSTNLPRNSCSRSACNWESAVKLLRKSFAASTSCMPGTRL